MRRHLGASQLLLGAIRPWHYAHGFISWLTAQGLGALVLARGGGRPHQAPCRCGHGVHTTHVVEPCVRARVTSVCFRHAQGRAMVPRGTVKAFLGAPSFESPTPPPYLPLKSNTCRFHCLWRRHQYA